MLLLILYGQHGEVVALFGLPYEVVDGIGHQLYECGGLVLSSPEQGLCHADDAVVAKLGVEDVLGLVESIGVEEDGGLRVEGDLLQGELPVGHDADGQVRVAGQRRHVLSDEQG